MESETKPLISIVIPLYNEAAHLLSFLSAIGRQLAGTDCRAELIVIDDGSADQTWQTLAEAAKTVPSLHALRLSRNFGKELALCAGLERARGDAVIVMDGDGQHPPGLLPEMIK